jgi:hypothetical protein
MNHMLRLIGALLFLIFVPAFAQTKDTAGWGKVKWGMTVEQAKAAYGAEAEDSAVVPGPNYIFIDKLTLPNVKIGDLEMTASLQVPKGSNQIKQVTLSLKADMQAPTSVRSWAFERLKALVIGKYGAPANQDTATVSDDLIKTVLWSLPTTTITLRWSESSPGIKRGTSC